MGSSLSFPRRVVGVVAAAIAVSLLTPPLPHNHGENPAAYLSHLACPCSSSAETPHLHAGETHPAPSCPACAVGPLSFGVPAHAPVAVAHAATDLVTPAPALLRPAWGRPLSLARDPPRPLAG